MNICTYCAKPFPPRMTRSGGPRATQPRTCSPEHAKRMAVWDTWVRESGLAAIGSVYGPRKVAALPPAGVTLSAALAVL